MGPAPCTNGRLFIVLLLVLAAADFARAGTLQNPPPPGPYNTTKFSPSMATVIIVLIVIPIAFFFVFFLCLFMVCIHRCYGDNSYSATRLPIGERGLDPAVLESFPTMAYADVKEHKAVKGALECAVCLSELDDDETLRLLPRCSHVFHPDCIDTWLASHITCPVCRANLVPNRTDFPATGDELSQPPQQVPPPASATEAAPTVVIDVEESEDERIIREETDELARIGSLKRALRSKSPHGARPLYPVRLQAL